MSLHYKLNSLTKYPMHMPGHKRNGKFNIVGSNIDATEIEGLDNLHAPKGVIKEIENKLARIYHCDNSHLLVNGSTVGLLASIMAVCKEGDTIIVACNCHKSVYNACVLLRLNVIFVTPKWNELEGYYTTIDREDIRKAISDNPDARAVVVTSPTYEGNVSNIGNINIPVITDAAHGAHFGISYFPAYPKGDIVISSLHKTLPSLTQTAVCNVYNKELEYNTKKYLDILQTTSPSYVLMNSVDICCDYILNQKSEFDDYYGRLTEFRSKIELEHLSLKYTDDPGKIVISTANANISGVELADTLRNKYGIEPEMASISYVILMTSVGDEEPAFSMLKEALEDIDAGLCHQQCRSVLAPNTKTDWNAKAVDDYVATDICEAVGKISAEFVMAYPPDIPILLPNAEITPMAMAYISDAIAQGINIVSDSGLLPNKILTKAGI